MRTTTLLLASTTLMLSGCALFEGKNEVPFITEAMLKPLRLENTAPGQSDATRASNNTLGEQRETAYYQTPKPPAAKRNIVGNPPPDSPPLENEGSASVNLENMPIPQFANAVFGAILKRNVSIDPQILQRTDLVSLRTGKPQPADQLFRAAQAVLRSYGVAVTEYQGLVRIVPDRNESGYLPEIRRGRAQPEVPGGLRPVFYLVELEHTHIANAVSWLRTLFGSRITIQEDNPRNALLLNGPSDTITAALEAIQLLDQPALRGRISARIAPVFWSADEMAKRLTEILSAEGYFVSSAPTTPSPLLILPVGPANSVIVFATNEQALNHTLKWAQELDQRPQGRSGGYITYQVKNSSASDLAKTLQEVIGGSTTTTSTATAGTAGASPQATQSSGGKKVVVNPSSNSLIIQTTPNEYQQWYGLLQELDRPAKSALIMATVAEVRLTDSEQFGFQWLLNQFKAAGQLVTLKSSGGISTVTGPSITFANAAGTAKALLNFLATSNKIRILSNPSVVARNGETASIQVGQEVPILTSQISNANTGTATGTGTLQTIQYRSTGVILKVKPVIHSGGKLDLDVAQEVSAAQSNDTGVNTTPIILTRKIDTKLTVTDGSTTLLGGLISENRTAGNSGIPLLKDLPVAGALFRTSANTASERTELVILLTPYVLEDDFEAQAMTDAFRSQFRWGASIPNESFVKPTRPSQSARTETLAKDSPLAGEATPPSQQATQPAPEVSEKAKPTQSKSKENNYRSKAYLIPENDPVEPANESVASTPQPSQAFQPTAIPTSQNTPPVATPTPPPQKFEGKQVTDEALKAELLRALQIGK